MNTPRCTYLQFRRNLRRYYRFESDDRKASLFSRRKSALWRSQYARLIAGPASSDVMDAALVAYHM